MASHTLLQGSLKAGMQATVRLAILLVGNLCNSSRHSMMSFSMGIYKQDIAPASPHSPDLQMCFGGVGVWVLSVIEREGAQQHDDEQHPTCPHIHTLAVIAPHAVSAVDELR